MAYKFSSEQIDALRLLKEAVAPASWVLIGGAGLACQMEVPRITQDLDFIVAIDVQDYYELMERLPHIESSSVPEHRWITPQNVTIDIIPAGIGSVLNSTLLWPKSGSSMNMTGVNLAFQHTVSQEIADDLVIKVAQKRVILFLKMVACLDTSYPREKDLIDIIAIITENILPDDERWTNDVFEKKIDYEYSSAFICGNELKEIVSDNEKVVVREFISKVKDETKPIQPLMAKLGRKWRHNPDKMLKYIDLFMTGFEGN